MTALLDAGAEVDARGEHGYTPLHEAVEQGHSQAVALLLERGASTAVTNDDGQTPIALAQICQRTDITQLFHGT
jgi:FOG: Ankyrin repeat